MGSAYPTPARGTSLTISYGLVNIGVKYAPLTDSQSNRVSGKFLDPATKQPAKQQYVNEAGEAVEKVTGYPTEDGNFVVLDPEDVVALKSPKDGRLELKAYVDPDDIDLLVYNEKTYVVWPDKNQEASYDVLCSVLDKSGRYLVGTAVLDKSTKVVVLRYQDGCILAQTCKYDVSVRWNDRALVVGAAGERPVADPQLVSLAEQVFEGLDDTFDFSAVEDEYDARLRAAIAAKAAGEPVPTQEAAETPAVTGLLEALKASVEAAKDGGAKAKPKKAPAKRTPRTKKVAA